MTLLRARLGQVTGAVAYDVLECDRRPTPLGEARYVRIHRKDKAPMGFRELWDVFDRYYPACWAVQVFPPRAHLRGEPLVHQRAQAAMRRLLPEPKSAERVEDGAAHRVVVRSRSPLVPLGRTGPRVGAKGGAQALESSVLGHAFSR